MAMMRESAARIERLSMVAAFEGLPDGWTERQSQDAVRAAREMLELLERFEETEDQAAWIAGTSDKRRDLVTH